MQAWPAALHPSGPPHAAVASSAGARSRQDSGLVVVHAWEARIGVRTANQRAPRRSLRGVITRPPRRGVSNFGTLPRPTGGDARTNQPVRAPLAAAWWHVSRIKPLAHSCRMWTRHRIGYRFQTRPWFAHGLRRPRVTPQGSASRADSTAAGPARWAPLAFSGEDEERATSSSGGGSTYESTDFEITTNPRLCPPPSGRSRLAALECSRSCFLWQFRHCR
jgi:hypothetical protein